MFLLEGEELVWDTGPTGPSFSLLGKSEYKPPCLPHNLQDHLRAGGHMPRASEGKGLQSVCPLILTLNAVLVHLLAHLA